VKKDYLDIIEMPYPRPLARPRMSLRDRAAQFAPFAALTGYDSVIGRTARENEEKYVELEEDMI